jgi:hypothetical protein
VFRDTSGAAVGRKTGVRGRGGGVQYRKTGEYTKAPFGRALAHALGVELEIIVAIQVPAVLAELDLVNPASYARCQSGEAATHLKVGQGL